MPFDVQGALKAGYTKLEVAAHLANEAGIDFGAASQHYSPDELIQQLAPDNLGIAKAASTGAAEGALGATVGLPGDVKDMMGDKPMMMGGGRMGGGMPVNPPSVKDIGEWLYDKTGGRINLGYKPIGRTEEYAKAGARGIGAFAPLPLGEIGAVGRTGLGMISGTVGEAGREYGGAAGEVTGQMAPLAATAFLEGKKPQIVKALGKYLAEIGPDAMRAGAQKAKTASQILGTPVATPQGMDQLGPLSGIMNAVSRSMEGQVARKVLDRQLPVGQENIDELIRAITCGPTGQNEANQVAAAVEKALARPAEMRTRATAPLYAAAGKEKIPPNVIAAMLDKLEAARESAHLPKSSDAGRAVSKTGQKLKGTQEESSIVLVDKSGRESKVVLPSDALGVEQIRREASTYAQAADRPTAQGPDLAKKAGHSAAADVIKKEMETAAPLTTAARAKHKELSPPVDEMNRSALARMAQDTSKPANWDELRTVLDNPQKYSAGDVAFVAQELNRADPEAFPKLVKQHFRDKLAKTGGMEGGRVSQDVLSEFPEAVAGAPGSPARENFMEAIKQVHRAKGAPPEAAEQAARGASNLIDALQVIARERNTVGTISTEEMARGGGSNLWSKALKTVNPINPGWLWGGVLERAVRGQTYRKIADALVDPDKVEILIKAGQYSASDVRTQLVLRNLIGLSAQQEAGDAGR